MKEKILTKYLNVLLILHGPDTYRSRRKLREIIEEYCKKAVGNFNLHRFDAEENDLSGVNQLMEASSLFGGKKLVVVENALSSENFKSSEFKSLKDTIVVFWDRELNEQGKKHLAEIEPYADKTQEFKNLTKEHARQWIQEEAKHRGVRLYPAHLAYLDQFGSDLWAVSNELDKVAAGSSAEFKNLPQAGSRSVNIFTLGDTFFTSKKEALRILLGLMHEGHDEFNIFSYLLNHARTLLTVKAYSEMREPLMASHGIHPFVIKKAAAIVRGLSMMELRQVFQRFFEEDLRIKIGLSTPRDSLFGMLVS